MISQLVLGDHEWPRAHCFMSDGGGVGGGSGGGAPGGGAPGGVTSIPSSVGTGEGSSATAADVSGEADAFAGFEGFTSDDVEPAAATVVQQPPLATPQAPPVMAPPVQPQVHQPPVAGVPTRPEDVTLANVQSALRDQQQALIDHWAGNFFRLSQAEIDGLTTNPEVVLPHLLAKGLYYALSSVPSQIAHFVPSLVNSTVETTARYERNAGEFYAAWPGLKGQEAATVRVLQMLIAQNPQITQADAIRVSGNMVCSMLGLDPRVAASGGGIGTRAAPARVVAQNAYVPAGVSGAGTGSVNGGRPAPMGDWFDGFDLPFTE